MQTTSDPPPAVYNTTNNPELGLVDPPEHDAITQAVLHDLTHSLDYWERYFEALLALSFFGCQATFPVIPSDISDPLLAANGPLNINKHTVRTFVSLAFFFFLCTLSAAATGKTILANPTTKIRILDSVGNRQYWALKWLSIAACWIEYLPMLAFLFLGLAIAAYVPVMGFLVALLFLVSLALKMYYGHGDFRERGRRGRSFGPAAILLLWPGGEEGWWGRWFTETVLQRFF